MNILIVGNGFDLSHYLPTKYDHFMDAMGAIEEKDTGGLAEDLSVKTLKEWLKQIDGLFEHRKDIAPPAYHMSFEELFVQTRDPNFIEKTREYYLVDQILISAKDVIKLQYRLSLNCWYQFFKSHVNEVKTWIDFEKNIEKLLNVFGNKVDEIEALECQNSMLKYFNNRSDNNVSISDSELKLLNFFQLTINEKGTMVPESGGSWAKPKATITGNFNNINKKFCIGNDHKNGFSSNAFVEFLNNQLEDFIEIFDLYLELIVIQLNSRSMLEIDSKEWVDPDKIFSFNYTNTYQRIHDSVAVEYLHGSHGAYQNIVLGVSDLELNSLKRAKAYGFTKYHQKLFKDTDYLFLDKLKEKVKSHKRRIEYFEKDFGDTDPIAKKFERQKIMEQESKLDLNFYIWGHSLDVSDKDYIIDLFSLNDDMDRNVRVTVYYFNKTAKFDLLNNLLAILGKDKVEQWMKNKWLVFKPNPEIKFAIENTENLDQVS